MFWILQKTAFSQVKSRFALGSLGCLFGRPFGCFQAKMAQYKEKWLLSETLFLTRQDQERGMIGPASLLHS